MTEKKFWFSIENSVVQTKIKKTTVAVNIIKNESQNRLYYMLPYVYSDLEIALRTN